MPLLTGCSNTQETDRENSPHVEQTEKKHCNRNWDYSVGLETWVSDDIIKKNLGQWEVEVWRRYREDPSASRVCPGSPVCCPDQQHQDHAHIYSTYGFLSPTSNLLSRNSQGGVGSQEINPRYRKPTRWSWCTLTFENRSSVSCTWRKLVYVTTK